MIYSEDIVYVVFGGDCFPIRREAIMCMRVIAMNRFTCGVDPYWKVELWLRDNESRVPCSLTAVWIDSDSLKEVREFVRLMKRMNPCLKKYGLSEYGMKDVLYYISEYDPEKNPEGLEDIEIAHFLDRIGFQHASPEEDKTWKNRIQE